VVQCSRQVIDAVDGFFVGKRFLLHDRDPLFTETFRQTLAASCRDRAAPAQIAEFALVRRARSVEVLRTVSRVIALPWRSDARPPARSRSGTRDRFDARSGGAEEDRAAPKAAFPTIFETHLNGWWRAGRRGRRRGRGRADSNWKKYS